MARCPGFSRRQLGDLFSLLSLSVEKRREMGLVIAGTPTRPRLGAPCTGTRCAIRAPRGRARDELGFYHTHPEGPLQPSPEDFRMATGSRHGVMCLGGPSDSELVVRCYLRPDEPYRLLRQSPARLWLRVRPCEYRRRA